MSPDLGKQPARDDLEHAKDKIIALWKRVGKGHDVIGCHGDESRRNEVEKCL